MSRKDTIRLYDEHLQFKTHLSLTEAQEMLDSGDFEEAYEMRGNKPHEIGIKKKQKQQGRPSLDHSDPSLSESDMTANVGITNGELGGPANARRIKAAHVKVKMWPLVYDDKAAYVPPRV